MTLFLLHGKDICKITFGIRRKNYVINKQCKLLIFPTIHREFRGELFFARD